MIDIPFTQYLLPDGRTKEISMSVDDVIGNMALDCIKAGYSFDAEVLQTGIISITSVLDEDIICIELSENGPPVEDAVKKLITDTYAEAKGE